MKRQNKKSVVSSENKALTTWLKRKRLEGQHTMRTLGELLGTPHSFVGKVENQERRLDVVELLWYCEALNANPIEAIQITLDAKGKKPAI